MCVCALSLSLSLVSGSISSCVFFADLQVLWLCGARVCVGGQVLVCSFFVVVCVSVYICLCVCVSVCLSFSLGLQWKSVNCMCEVCLFPSLCLLVPTFWKVWCF